MIKRILVDLTIIVSAALIVLYAESEGEMRVKKHTQVVIFDIRKSHGPWFGQCAQLQLDTYQIACATETK